MKKTYVTVNMMMEMCMCSMRMAFCVPFSDAISILSSDCCAA